MSDLRFAGTGQDRRRRMLAADPEPMDANVSVAPGDSSSLENQDAAFPLLSRDDVMKKMISPRVWKHNVVACLLIAMPFLIAGFRLPGQDREQVERIDTAIRGLCGLELFIASQLCLLICWVRSASAVDFAGVFRAWRWMSLVLLASALLTVTNLAEPVTFLLANWLQQAIGSIRAARPALLFVPLCASGVFVLRHILPDMGRCRMAQGSLAIAALLVLARIALSVRGPILSSTTLELWELLICGLVLSSVHMHSRYVIYVNPNPPAVKRGSTTTSQAMPSASINEGLTTQELPTIPISIVTADQSHSESSQMVLDVKQIAGEASPPKGNAASGEVEEGSKLTDTPKKAASKLTKTGKSKRRAG